MLVYYMKNERIKIRRTFDQIELTAEDVLEAIEILSNEERWKLLEEMFFRYYTKHGIERGDSVVIEALIELKKNMDERFDQFEEKIDQQKQI